MEKLCFLPYSVKEFIEIEAGLLLTFFRTFIQSIKFYTFHCHILNSAGA